MAMAPTVERGGVAVLTEVVIKPLEPQGDQKPAKKAFKSLGVSVVQHGSCVVTTEYFNGPHPYLGRPHPGLTGEETAIERVSIKPVRTFMVKENETLAGIEAFSRLRKMQRILQVLQEDELIQPSLKRATNRLIDKITAVTDSLEDQFNLT